MWCSCRFLTIYEKGYRGCAGSAWNGETKMLNDNGMSNAFGTFAQSFEKCYCSFHCHRLIAEEGHVRSITRNVKEYNRSVSFSKIKWDKSDFCYYRPVYIYNILVKYLKLYLCLNAQFQRTASLYQQSFLKGRSTTTNNFTFNIQFIVEAMDSQLFQSLIAQFTQCFLISYFLLAFPGIN